MRDKLGSAVFRLTVFLLVCGLALFGLLAIFAQLRFTNAATYRAEFTNVSGLEAGNFVRIAGVEVGKVTAISLEPDSTAVVDFTADDTVVLTQGTHAVIRYADLIGGRYLALEEGPGDVLRLEPGGTIPLQRTAPALDLDALIGGFRPLFRALDPDQVNALSGQLIAAFQGEGGAINSFLDQTAALTKNLADRGDLISQVITNLNTVLVSLGDRSSQFAKAIDSLSALVAAMSDRRSDITNAVAYANESAVSVADFLAQGRPAIQKTVNEVDRTSSVVVADHEYVDHLLATLPDTYKALGRQGLYGDYFSFYLCDLILKLNGKGGQPVYVKVVGQSSGRCAPR